MPSPLVKPSPTRRSNQQNRYKKRPSAFLAPKRLDAATLAANLQLQEQRREFVCSVLGLTMKTGLLALGVVSLFKLCFAYEQRLDRHGELAAVLDLESSKLTTLRNRFDSLFTLGGGRRLMNEQDQWIAPNRMRVIWR